MAGPGGRNRLFGEVIFSCGSSRLGRTSICVELMHMSAFDPQESFTA
jgi:hypothetical protein